MVIINHKWLKHYGCWLWQVSTIGLGPTLESIGRAPLEFQTTIDYSDYPENFRIVRYESTSCTFAWDYPLDNGGANVESYKIVTTVEDDKSTGNAVSSTCFG